MSMGRVAVVWGDNRELARAVGSELARFGFEPHVGGDERGPGSWYDRVTRGFKADSWAIVLMQWPSDIEGLPCDHVPLFDAKGRPFSRPELARRIVESFITSMRPNWPTALGAFVDWAAWKSWIRRQLDSIVPPDDLRLALSLLHSIQPAFYAGELPDLLTQVDRIKASRDGRTPSENRAVAPELTAACNVVKAACCYYRLQARDTPPPLNDYFDIADGCDSERLRKFKEYAWLEVQLVSLEILQGQRRLKPELEEKYVATVGRLESRLPRPKLPAKMRGLILHLIAIGSQNNIETVRRVSSSFEERVSKYAEYEDDSWSYV